MEDLIENKNLDNSSDLASNDFEEEEIEEVNQLEIIPTRDTINIIARGNGTSSSHEIHLRTVLGYYWQNDEPPIKNFFKLFEQSIKRTINNVMAHERLLISYDLTYIVELEESNTFKIKINSISADGIDFDIIEGYVVLEGLDHKGTINKIKNIRKKVKRTIEREI
ncbi:MAG: hypothetical protein ACRCVG_07720 [Methanobacteriaceae archaeon]